MAIHGDFSGFFRIFQDFFQRILKSSSGFWRILEGLLEVAPRWRLGGKRVAAGWEPLGGREGGREGGRIDEGTIAGGFFRDSW